MHHFCPTGNVSALWECPQRIWWAECCCWLRPTTVTLWVFFLCGICVLSFFRLNFRSVPSLFQDNTAYQLHTDNFGKVSWFRRYTGLASRGQGWAVNNTKTKFTFLIDNITHGSSMHECWHVVFCLFNQWQAGKTCVHFSLVTQVYVM